MSQGRSFFSFRPVYVAALGVAALLSVSIGTESARAQAAEKAPTVILETSAGAITIELAPDKAPITVKNFLTYVDEGFYNNLIFHRVIDGFMVQTGGLDDKMQEKREGQHGKIRNESGNGLSNQRGTLAMARTSDPNSATSQFFINLVNNRNLDNYGGGYAVFGKVIGGMEVVDAIAKSQTTSRGPHQDVPVKPIFIKSAKRQTK